MSKNLNDAAMAGNLKEVEMRLNMGEDVNQTQFPRYTTALHDATACGRIEVARLLIKRYSASLLRNGPLPFDVAQEVTRLSDLAEILHVPISAATVRFPKIFEALPGIF